MKDRLRKVWGWIIGAGGAVAAAACMCFLVGCNTSGAQFAKTAWGTTSYVKKTTVAPDGTKTEEVLSGVNKDTIEAIALQTSTNANDLARKFAEGYLAGQATAAPVPALPGMVAPLSSLAGK